MDHQQQRGWDEQLQAIYPKISKHLEDIKEDESADNSKSSSAVSFRGEAPAGFQSMTQRSAPSETYTRSSPPSQDSIEVSGNQLNIRTAAGDTDIQLNEADRSQMVQNALSYQKAIITERRTNAFATIAMAILAGLSALAIAFTLFKGSTGGKQVITL